MLDFTHSLSQLTSLSTFFPHCHVSFAVRDYKRTSSDQEKKFPPCFNPKGKNLWKFPCPETLIRWTNSNWTTIKKFTQIPSTSSAVSTTATSDPSSYVEVHVDQDRHTVNINIHFEILPLTHFLPNFSIFDPHHSNSFFS